MEYIKTKGNKFLIKENLQSQWKYAKREMLKSLLSEETVAFSDEKKKNIPMFGFGKYNAESKNQQIYPSQYVVLELDAPAKEKQKIKAQDKGSIEKWSSKFEGFYNKFKKDDNLNYRVMYITPSRCGIRFILKTNHNVNNEDEYKTVALVFLAQLKKYGINEKYYDIRVNQGWLLPTFGKFFHEKKKLFNISSILKAQANIIPIKSTKTTLEDAKKDNSKYVLIIEAIIKFLENENQSITSTHNDWYKVAYGLANTFSNEIGKDYFLRLCRLDMRNHKEEDSIKKWDYCYENANKEGTNFNTIISLAKRFGFRLLENNMTNQLFYTLEELLSMPENNDMYLLEPIFPKSGLVAIVGKPDCGKSLFTRQLLIAISNNEPTFLGFPLKSKYHRAICVCTEDDKMHISSLLKKQTKELSIQSNTNLKFLIDGSLSLKKLLEILTSELAKAPADVVVIDGYGDIFEGKDGNNNMLHRNTLKQISEISTKYETLVLLIHHINKSSYDKTPQQQDAQGGSAFAQKVRAIISLRNGNENEKLLTVTKGNYCPKEYKNKYFKLNFNEDTCTFHNTGETTIITNSKNNQLAKNKKIVQEIFSKKQEMSYTELWKAYMEISKDSEATAKRFVKEMTTQEIIKKTEEKLYKLYK